MRFLFFTLLTSVLSAQSISITSPTASQTLSGTSLTLASTLTSLPSTYSVTYNINGIQDGTHVACIARSAPWSCTWNTYYDIGGPYESLTATARDVLNNVLATSASIGFTVANLLPVPPGAFTWTVSASASPWSGNKTVTPSFSGTDSGSGAAHYFVDGLGNAAGFGNSIHTTLYDNGTHIVRAIGLDTASTTWQGAQEWEQVVTFSNGSAPMELRIQPGYEIFLCVVGSANCPTSVNISGNVFNTDGTSAAATFPPLRQSQRVRCIGLCLSPSAHAHPAPQSR